WRHLILLFVRSVHGRLFAALAERSVPVLVSPLRGRCMDMTGRSKLRKFVAELLINKDDTDDLVDSESLFASGRLDSLAAVEVVAFLEQAFAIDFDEADFDIQRIDSVDAMGTLGGETPADPPGDGERR